MARLVRFWMTAAERESATAIVLLVDEGQRFSIPEWTWLSDATNALLQNKVVPVLIAFGQPELAALRDVLMAARRADLLGRFFTRLYSFDGLRSVADVEHVLKYYDDPAWGQFPENSGCSYSQFFNGLASRSIYSLVHPATALFRIN
jgi:hypothetical protein